MKIMELMKQGLLQLMVRTSSETVCVSRVEFELSEGNYSKLTASVDPLENSSNFGINLHNRTLQYLNSVTTQ